MRAKGSRAPTSARPTSAFTSDWPGQRNSRAGSHQPAQRLSKVPSLSGLRLYQANRLSGHTKNNVHESVQAIGAIAEAPLALAKNFRRRVEAPDQRPDSISHPLERHRASSIQRGMRGLAGFVHLSPNDSSATAAGGTRCADCERRSTDPAGPAASATCPILSARTSPADAPDRRVTAPYAASTTIPWRPVNRYITNNSTYILCADSGRAANPTCTPAWATPIGRYGAPGSH